MDIEKCTLNQRQALSKGLAALDAMAALWASEINLSVIATNITNAPEETRATAIAAMIEQAFVEGAYRHYLDHKDAAAPTPPAQPEWWQQYINDVNRLVREMDVTLNGEEGAAQQASLCDMVAQISAMKRANMILSEPPAQEDEPVAWLIPRIVQYPSCTDTVVSWGASVFCDSQDKARVDSKGNVYYPKSLYTRPQSDKLRKAAEELDKFIHDGMHFGESAYEKEMIRLVGSLRAALERK